MGRGKQELTTGLGNEIGFRWNGSPEEKETSMEPNETIIPRSTKIGIRVSDYKPGVLYQTQAAGIEFVPSYHQLATTCPKCGASNTQIYFPKLLRQRHVSGASVRCHVCGIPYPVEIEG